jgi:hypothetical protein
LAMMEITGLVLCTDCAGISTSSPAAEVKRIPNESPYTSAVAGPFRRDVITSRLTKVFQIMLVSVCWGAGTFMI